MTDRPQMEVRLSEFEIELIVWALGKASYSEIGGYWLRHGIDVEPQKAAWDLYQRLMTEWDDWSKTD